MQPYKIYILHYAKRDATTADYLLEVAASSAGWASQVERAIQMASEGAALYAEMIQVAGAVRRAFDADHMNYLSLGNMVRHVHWHIYPRCRNDPNWGGAPIPEPAAYRLADNEYREVAAAIRSVL